MVKVLDLYSRMLARFYAPDAGRRPGESRVTLPSEEAAHLSRVLRLSPGDAIHVFDGQGREWRAEVIEVSRRQVVVALIDAVAPTAEPRIPLTLGIAVLKGDKMDDVVRDAVMLGVGAIQPLLTERTEVNAAALSRGRRIERWQRIAVASAKQCRRAVVPTVRPAAALDACVADEGNGVRLLFVEPGQRQHTGRLQDLRPPLAAMFFIGPEGGWTEAELESAEHSGVRLVTLGGLTLRADAMPVVALTAAKTVWEDF
jgi:16S rRNA (uracil1498-N3)-methyltransferase